jgi:hypothetical protein
MPVSTWVFLPLDRLMNLSASKTTIQAAKTHSSRRQKLRLGVGFLLSENLKMPAVLLSVVSIACYFGTLVALQTTTRILFSLELTNVSRERTWDTTIGTPALYMRHNYVKGFARAGISQDRMISTID